MGAGGCGGPFGYCAADQLLAGRHFQRQNVARGIVSVDACVLV